MEKAKKFSVKSIFLIISFITIISLILIKYYNKPVESAQTIKNVTFVEWDKMNYAQKEAWIISFLNSNDNDVSDLKIQTMNMIKNEFRQPSKVKLKNIGLVFADPLVSDAIDGKVIYKGTAISENSIGAKVENDYIVEWIVSPFQLSINDIKILMF